MFVQARKESKDVTPEDLALREDICYQIFGDVGPLVRGSFDVNCSDVLLNRVVLCCAVLVTTHYFNG